MKFNIPKIKKQQKKTTQNNKSSQQFKYSYSIIPTNFVNLSEENQVQKLGQFNYILRVIEDISKEDDTGIEKIIDNMETKIILGLEKQAAETARKVLNFSDQETNKTKSFNRGHALFLTKNHRIHAKFDPTPQEKEMFDTIPLE